MALTSPSSSPSRTKSGPSACRRSQSLFFPSSSGFASSSSTAFLTSSSSRTPQLSAYTDCLPPSPSSSSSVRFANRPGSPGRSISVTNPITGNKKDNNPNKKTCLCSPTTHPGSFRCALHKNSPRGGAANNSNSNSQASSNHSSIRLNYRRSAMTNSLVRIGVEGDWVKRALSALIRPSSHSQRRRMDFQPKPSRLSVMSKASDHDVV